MIAELKRIQRKRIKGWKAPENTINITRPSEFGNPFKVGGLFKVGSGGDKQFVGFTYVQCLNESYNDGSFIKIKDNAHAVEMYQEYITRFPLSKQKIEKLRGHNLMCFCKEGEPCHGDILLKIANQ